MTGGLPPRWAAGDPEPDGRVTEVVTCDGQRWRRISHTSDLDYRWTDGDKTRPWNMLLCNRGPLVNAARLSAVHSAYRRKHG